MTENEIINTTKQKGETARLVHKQFFARCNFAIENGFYLEALFMEYAYIEDRVNVIMRELNNPCSLKINKSQYNVGLATKLICLKNLVDSEECFKNAHLKRSDIRKVGEWCEKRNMRIHRLYDDTEKYEKVMNNNKKYAVQGFEYARLFSDEANRLKKYMKKNTDYVLKNKTLCAHNCKASEKKGEDQE